MEECLKSLTRIAGTQLDRTRERVCRRLRAIFEPARTGLVASRGQVHRQSLLVGKDDRRMLAASAVATVPESKSAGLPSACRLAHRLARRTGG